MDPVRIAWATQSYKLNALPVSSQRCVNYYAEREPPDAKTDIAVLACPGVELFSTCDGGPIRGMNVMNGILYVVSGQSLYSVASNGSITLLGSGISGYSVVSMANNGFQVIIVNGVSGWVYAPSETYYASAAVVSAGGANYVVGDQITIGGGVYSTPVILTVLTLSGSAVATVSVNQAGQYSTTPADPAAQLATTGVGLGATFTMTWTGPPTGFTQITDPNFNAADTVTFYDEYFILDWMGTNQWFFSQILDGTTYNALDYNTAAVDSSYVLATVNQQENLLIFKQKSIETWYDSGANNNPFARYNGATIERGCAASLAIVKEDNGVFFLGNDLVFYRLDGVMLSRKSTFAIEKEWETYQTTNDAFVFSYTFGGHKFIVLTFPGANVTWVFDIASDMWHERVSYVATTPFAGRWRGNCSVVFNNKTLIGDANSGQIGYLSETIYTEFGSTIIGMMDSPPVQKNRKRLFISKLEINMQTGTGAHNRPRLRSSSHVADLP